jgi:multidrug efflux system outer membrane protein
VVPLFSGNTTQQSQFTTHIALSETFILQWGYSCKMLSRKIMVKLIIRKAFEARQKTLVAVIGIAVAVSLSSCATPVGPCEGQVPEIPEQWRHGEGKQDETDFARLRQWWEQFQDPMLSELIQQALASSPDIRTALSRVEESRARVGVQQSTLWPSLSGGVSAQTSRSENRQTDKTTTTDRFSAGLDASWEIDLWGKNRALVDAAHADFAQSVESYHAAQVTLASEVALAYVSLRTAEIRLRIVQDNLKLREETVRITEWREQAGQASALEARQAISTLEQARASIPALQQAILQGRNRLALLLGRTPESGVQDIETPGGLPTVPESLVLLIPAETLRQRPDIRMAEQAIVASRSRTVAANQQRLPSLQLSGSLGIDDSDVGSLFSSPETIAGSLLARLTGPIFDAGRIQKNIQIQSEQEQQSWIAYEKAVLNALTEVENALIALKYSRDRILVLRRATDAAQQAAELAAWKYQAGEVDLLVVLEAQRTLLSLEEQSASAREEEVTACVQLYKSLGGGWTPLDASQRI